MMMMNLSILIFIAIISTCISVALADVQSNNTNVILNHIITTNNDNNVIAQQQLTCNETTIQIYGMYPMQGSELGSTPVALAVQFDGNNDDDIRERLNCNFGSSIQPLINGDDMYDQLERIALASSNSSYANNNPIQLGSNYKLLLCKSPAATSIGTIPFHISCHNQEEEQQTSSSIESTLQFEYTIATSAHTIHPSLGTPNYTTVTITGSGYANSTYQSCFFGRDHVVFATYISSEEVQCSVPTSLPLSEEEGRDEYPIFISNNGIDYEGEDWATVTFVTVPLPIVQSVESNTVTWSTDSNVTVIGLHFDPHASLSKAVCSFEFERGDVLKTSVGLVVNDTQINCHLPTIQEDELVQSSPVIGNIRVSTNDGIDYSTSYSSIFIYGPLSLQSVHPNSASLESGGTIITLYGLNFHPAKTLSCLFTLVNDYVIPISATYHSSSKVTCQTPQSMMVGVAQLSVSTINQDMSNSIDFTFLSVPTIISATPLRSSSWSGGTIVTIEGGGFNADDNGSGTSTYCQFGNALVVANVLNSTTLTCITPPVTLVRHDVSLSHENSLLDGALDVSLEVSINGYSTTNSGITFQYHSNDSMDAPIANDEDEVDTHQIDPTTVQVTSFSPTFGSDEGGTIIHLVGTGFDEEVSPQCVFNDGESSVATVISHTLIKCIVPPSAGIGQTNTSVGLSFNGDDLVLADTSFSYISSPIITDISPKYISSNGGSKLTISGTNFAPDEHLVGVLKCSFGDTVVAASVTSEGDIVCFTPPIKPGVVEVRVSINGVDFTAHSVKVISHLTAEIHDYTLQKDDDMVVVDGINFQPSPDLSCIFNVQDGRITAVATWESNTKVTCSIPPIVVGATSTTLEISNTNEHHLDNPSISFHFPQRDESLSSSTSAVKLEQESETGELANKYSISIDSIEPKAISEVGGELLTIHIVSDLQLGAGVSCAFEDLATSKTKTSPASAVISKYANNGKRSTLVTCPTPEMIPGDYTLSLEGINNSAASDIVTTITVYPEFSTLETSQPLDISSSSHNNANMRQLDELDKLSINIHPSFGPESGGNTVMINGSGFKANSSAVCRFGEDSVTPAKFISGESLECVAPPVVNHPVVNVSLTIDGVEWASSSQTYTYLPMLRINKISPPSMQIDVPHQVVIAGDNFEYIPSQLICKLGTTIIGNTTAVDESSVTCFIPPVYHPGEVALDIVTEDGTSMLNPNSSNNTIKFHTPIEYSIFPSFADMTGGTNVIITKNNLLEDSFKQLICRFNLKNDTSIDVVATQLSDTRHSCITPNVIDWLEADDHPIYATLSLVSEESHTSIPFMFKTTPMIESIFPSIGSVNGNTLVRVRSSSSMWVNSTLLTCLFGELEVRAIFVSARTVDCVSPPGHGIVTVKVSDNNNINLPESNQIYSFHDEPHVSLVTPSFGLASDKKVITLIGTGFTNIMESSCVFQGSSGSTHQFKGLFINETTIECHVGPEVLPPSQYVCRASNNGGIEYGGFNTTTLVHYTSLATPTIISTNPSSGISQEPINVTMLGIDLSVGSSSLRTYCVLLDHDGLWLSSSLADVQSDELIHCLVHCPIGNSTAKYSLGISLGGSDQVHSSSPFRCKPRQRILDVLPKYISVGESTPISINLEEFRSARFLNCVFGSGNEMVPATYSGNGIVECPSPVFNHPKRMALSLSADNLTITEGVVIDVIDPISSSRFSPSILFARTDVIIEGNNFIPDKMICTFEGSIGEIVTSNDTHVVCRSPVDLVSTSAEVILSINGAPQLNASAGYVDVLPPPRVDKVTPSSALALGGSNVIIHGTNFYDISNPLCYFGDAIVDAYILTDKTMSCKTPERNDVGEVSVYVSFDGGRSVQGGDLFLSFLAPVVLHDVYPQVVVNGTQIRLVGAGFTKAPIQCAFGDSMFTPASVLSSTEATCLFTSNNEDFGQIVVSIVSLDRIQLSIGDLNINYHHLVEIYSSSNHGTIMGGELIELQVYGILDDIITKEEGLGLIHCQFGDKFTLTTLEFDESIVSCPTPAADSPGNVSVSLIYGGLPFSSNTLMFEYTTQPQVASIHPTSGPLAGGTSVRIQGLNLQSIGSCKFGNELSYGYMDSENTIVCISPATRLASRHAVSLLLDSSKEWLDTGLDFHYIEPFTLESVNPLGINRGVEFISVYGRGYSRSTDLQCCFGGESDCILSEATVLSNTTLKCPLPSWDVIQEIGPFIPLSLTSNGVDFVQSPSLLTYQSSDMIVVTKVYPLVGPAFGGTVVDIYGLGFQEHASYWCCFGKVSSSRAEYISDGHIQCTTPTSFVKESEQVATASVTISSLTPHSLNSSLNFTFYSQPTRLAMYPTVHGVSGGGTKVKIGQLAPLLSKLQSSDIPLDPTCRFDTTVVPASIYEGGYIICTSPPIEATNLQNGTTQSVQASVSINGQDYISTYEHYHYYHPPSIHSVSPDIVWVGEEAAELIIRGSNFLPLNQASCIVGEELLKAEVVSSSEVRCLLQNLNHTDQVVPVSVSLNGGVDSSNILPLSCRVNAPMILSASPLFVSEAGGTTIELQGTGFDQIKSRGLIKLNDALVPLSVIDNTTASFDAPSGRSGDHVIQISYYGSTFTETGFELQYLPTLHISVINPAFVVLDTVNRVTISGSFGGNWNYKCVMSLDDNDVLEFTPSYVNETCLNCDIDLVWASAYHITNGHLAVHREEDDQTSNALHIYTTPRYAIESIDPSVLSEAQKNAGGQLLAIQSSQEVVLSAAPFFCRFTDSAGIITTTSVDIITAHELRCTIPPLTGGAQVCLTREDGTVQSNSIELSVRPTSQLIKLMPSSGPLYGGTNVTVQGIGFSAYSDVNILCQFGNEIFAAHIMDDEHIHCKTPSLSHDDNNVTFTLVQSSQLGSIPISNTNLTFQYYSQPKLVKVTPDNGPASGGHEISLHIEGLTDIRSSFTLSFTSVADQSYVTYTKDVKLLNQSTLQAIKPPSPTGSDGGMVVIQVSGNGQDYSTDGFYYNYTESAIVHSFYPNEVVEGSCFNLTILVDNLYTSSSHCTIGDNRYPASNGEVAGIVICNDACLDVHEGPYQVGLMLDNNVFLPASNDIQVRHRINAKQMTPFMGSVEGGTLVTIEGEFQEWSSQLYCFFGEHSILATAINDTAIQCITPPISMLEDDLLELDDNLLGVNVRVAPYHQSSTKDDITSSMVFNYYEKEVIDSVTPRSGSGEGGTTIQVYGSGFVNSTSLTCKFGEEVEFQAVFLNNEHIMCTSPPLSDVAVSQALPMSVPLMVSNNNKEYVSAGSFVYHATPQIIRLSPAIGPAQTSVRIHMKSSLGWVEHLVCRFGSILATNATVVSNYEVECVSPQVPVHLGETQAVEVEISLNGIDFFTSGHSFQYTNQPLIYSMAPEYGPISGGNAVVLHGKSLVFSQDNLLCNFGPESQTMAVSVLESKITCLAPASTKHEIVPFSIISIDTNIMLEQYHDDTVIQYKYLPPVEIASIYPSFGSMNGGTLLSIETKEEVPNVDELHCVFGGGNMTTIAQIDRINRSLLTCLTPESNTSGSISIGLAQDENATMLTTSNVQFRYTTDLIINDLYPRRGSSNSETNITLKGSNFSQGGIDSVVCKVGSHELPATFLSDEEVKCTAPPDIPIREIQAITIIGSSEEDQGSFTLGFKGEVSDPINIDSSVDEIRELLLDLPGLDDISVSIEDESSLDKTFLITFLGMVKEHQPLLTVEHTTVDVHIDRRQSLCCNVSLSLNGGVDFYDTDLVFVYHDKVVVTDVSPDHGTVSGGTNVELSMLGISSSQEDAMCIFGSIEVQGTWVNEETISCVSPESLDDATVAVGVKFSETGVRAESMAKFTYHHEPEILSIFPLSLPALHASKALDVYGKHFYKSESMTCVFDVSLPSEGGGVSLEDRLATHRESAIFHNSSHIQCPNPPTLQAFFSITDHWASNSTLVEGSILSVSLESGSDSYYIGTIPFHALVETTSLFPETGPRKGGTEVIVEGSNMMNTTHLACRFDLVVSPSAQYISPTKILCITPHYPGGYGRAVVPIQIALNGVDFSSVADDVMFEYHEHLVLKDIDPMASLPKGGSTINVALDDESMGFSAVRDRSPVTIVVSHLDPPYGPRSGGNVVTIVGQGFTANHATTCSFSGVSITASFVSEESLSCVAPEAVDDNMLVDVVILVDGDELIGIGRQYMYLPIKV